MKSLKAFAPATIANFNVGYDILGLSLNNIGDEIEFVPNGTDQNKITQILNGPGLPLEADKNCCSVVVRRMQEALNHFEGVDLKIIKGFNSGSGLGSSSASSAAAAFGYNELIGRPFSNRELVFFAAEGERVACGSAHTDNVAPSILGGIILSIGGSAEDLLELPVPENLYAISLFPKIKIKTADSRKILRDEVALNKVTKQVAYMGAFVQSLHTNDMNLFSRSLQDLIIEPSRSLLIPKFQEMRKAVMGSGGLAFGISGSGPSVFAIAEGEVSSKQVLKALENVYKSEEMSIQTYVNQLAAKSGARLIK
ncbi:MAG: homoserine kinase [Flavobacteriales bacterium]|nr:homoserine kinase [Flavobacteriales bacterium]